MSEHQHEYGTVQSIPGLVCVHCGAPDPGPKFGERAPNLIRMREDHAHNLAIEAAAKVVDQLAEQAHAGMEKAETAEQIAEATMGYYTVRATASKVRALKRPTTEEGT